MSLDQADQAVTALLMEQFDTCSKKVRGMGRKSLDLIEAMAAIAKGGNPITGRGVGYKLFTSGLIPSMAPQEMQRVYRLLKEARERDIIPWHWIVDEAREFECTPSWNDPEEFARAASRQYRRDFWQQQPVRCEVWSEKGTLRGVLAPVLDKYGVGFRVMHGFSSATVVHDIAEDDDGRGLIALYVGDWDPSGMYMSERDLPDRLEKYGGDHVELRRVALTREQLTALPSFPAADKRKDPRFRWFSESFGDRCWEIDALDPNALRARVQEGITALIEPAAWERCEVVNLAEQESLRKVMTAWAGRHLGWGGSPL
jgi:hypothetical protein